MSKRHLSVKSQVSIFVIFVAGFLSVSVYQHSRLRDFKSDVYQRCIVEKTYNDDAHDFRAAQLEAFQLLAVDPTLDPHRKAAYADLATKGKRVVESYVPANCEIYR